jgi:hypothetical protein
VVASRVHAPPSRPPSTRPAAPGRGRR